MVMLRTPSGINSCGAASRNSARWLADLRDLVRPQRYQSYTFHGKLWIERLKVNETTHLESLSQKLKFRGFIPDGKSAEAQRVAKTGGLLTHQHTTKLARQGFILSSHMLAVSPVPKRDRDNPLRRVFSCLWCQLVLIWFSQLRKEMT